MWWFKHVKSLQNNCRSSHFYRSFDKKWPQNHIFKLFLLAACYVLFYCSSVFPFKCQQGALSLWLIAVLPHISSLADRRLPVSISVYGKLANLLYSLTLRKRVEFAHILLHGTLLAPFYIFHKNKINICFDCWLENAHLNYDGNKNQAEVTRFGQ